MKHPNEYIAMLRTANLQETPSELISCIKLIQQQTVMHSFQNTTEDFNMESIQGEDEMTNDEIYRRLSL